MALLQNSNAVTPVSGFELKSARFDRNSASYLSRSNLSGGSTTKGTQSWWFKRSGLSTDQRMWGTYEGSSSVRSQIGWQAADKLYIQQSNSAIRISTQVLRDPSAWYHLVCAWDSTQAAAADRLHVYLNGEEITTWDTNTTISQNADMRLNNGKILIGQRETSSLYFDGYMAEFYQIDGYQCPPSKFGELNTKTNQWQPKEPKDIKAAVYFGTNGFYLPFSNDELATTFPAFPPPGNVFTPTETLSVNYLIIGGGGGGGDTNNINSPDGGGGGGGGAGEYEEGTGLSVTAQDYAVVVGGGGQKGWGPDSVGGTGGTSSFAGKTSVGGGGGGRSGTSPGTPLNGVAGGSGGGGSGGQDIGPPGNPRTGGGGGAATASGPGAYGFNGGAGHGGNGAGGGGAGGVGESVGEGPGGDGGAGKSSSITGSAVTYAGGGAGGHWSGWTGGGGSTSGGGGASGVGNSAGGNGTDGLGGGGGGAGKGTGGGGTDGGFGGSGIVIISYQSTTVKASGGTITTYGSGAGQYQVHSFTDTSTAITPTGNTKNERISNNTVVVAGDTHIIGPKVGSSAITFDGTGDYLSIGDSADFDFGTGTNFTLECWMNAGTQPNSVPALVGNASGYSSGSITFRFNGNNIGYYSYDGNGGTDMLLSSSTMNDNAWHHIAVVRITATWYMYVDGILEDTWTGTNPATDFSFGNTLYIGQNGWDGSNGQYKGYIDELRLSNVARYTANFTPATTEFSSDANTKLLIHSNAAMGSTTFTDSSSGTHAISANGNVKHIAPKIGTGMGFFPGNGYLTVTDSPDFKFNVGNFTIECWMYVTKKQDNRSVYTNCTSGNANGTQIEFVTADDKLGWWEPSLSGSPMAYSDNAIPYNQWVHMACVRNGPNFTMYIDGTAQSTSQTSSTPVTTPTGPQWGFHRSTTSRYLDDVYLDQMRISNSARYTANFTPSTTAFKDDINTVLLLHGDGGGGIDPETNLPTLAGQGTYFWDASTNAIFYDAAGLPTNKSLISFDGSGDKLTVAASSDFNFGTNPFTIEGWVYADTLDGGGQAEACTMVSSGTLATADNQWRVGIWEIGSIDRLSFAIYETAGGGGWPVHMYPNTFEPPIFGKWYHWAVTRSGNTWSMWTNGICTADDVDSLNWNMGANDIVAGYVNAWSNNYYLDGKQDQIRISDNSRYTGTYTVPTAAFSSDSDTSLLLHLDGANDGTTFTDSSSGAHTVSLTGNIVTKTGEKKFGTASGYFNGGSTNRLTVADHADFQFGTGAFTIEAWVYPVSAGGSVENMIVAKGDGTAYWMLRHEENNTQGRVRWYASENSATVADIKVDLGATRWAYDTWHHIAVTSDGTTHALLVDGTCIGACTAKIANWNYSGNPIVIGNNNGFSQTCYGYIDEVRITKGVNRYDAGRYTVPTTPFTSDANTKLLIQSDWSEGGIGADHSGNYNYFTPSNIGANDSMPDSPMNNFCTWNPLRNIIQTGWTAFSEGNLKAVTPATGGSSNGFTEATMEIPSSGKWYWETLCKVGGYQAVGIGAPDATGTYMGQSGSRGYYSADGNALGPSGGSYGSSYTVGDIIGCAVDMDNGAIYWAKNNTWQNSGDPTSGASKTGAGFTDLLTATDLTLGILPAMSDLDNAETATVIANFGQDSSFASEKTAQGNQDSNQKGDFYYAPPAGYSALCTDNLPAPSFSGVETGDNFNEVFYTGNGGTQAVTGVGFQPDFVWLKNRNSTGSHMAYDSIRGATYYLHQNEINAQTNGSNTTSNLQSFDSDGFTVIYRASNADNTNRNSYTYVSWNWKGGGTAVANTTGTIDTLVSANPAAGFSVVKFDDPATAADATIGHGLSQRPELVIGKPYNASDAWRVGSDFNGSTGTPKNWEEILQLQSSGAAGPKDGVFDGGDYPGGPTGSIIYLGDDGLNNSTYQSILYCFHSVEGYSKIGRYFGNGNTSGAFVYTGFYPKFILIKAIDRGEHWDIPVGNLNAASQRWLSPNLNSAERTMDQDPGLDRLANGFKIRTSDGNLGYNGTRFLYLAIAESPFKTSNAV